MKHKASTSTLDTKKEQPPLHAAVKAKARSQSTGRLDGDGLRYFSWDGLEKERAELRSLAQRVVEQDERLKEDIATSDEGFFQNVVLAFHGKSLEDEAYSGIADAQVALSNLVHK